MGATALEGKFDYYQGRLREGYMDCWYDALGIVFHLTVNKYFAEYIYGHSVHYVPSKTSISFCPQGIDNRCSRFRYVKHSGFYHPAYFDPVSLQMQQQQRFG